MFDYTPHQKQLEFHKDATKVFFRGVIAATGSGKTLCGVVEAVRWCIDNPGIVGFSYEPSMRMVNKILLPTLRKNLVLGFPISSNPFVRSYNKTDQCLFFKNNSELHFSSLDDPERAEGPNIDFAHIDEARLVDNLNLALQVVVRRLRGSGKNNNRKNPRGMWITTTPPPLKENDCLYRFFINPKTKDPSSKVYRFRMNDNPHLTSDYIDTVKRLHPGESDYKRFILGEFVPVGEGSFSFDQRIHVKDFSEDFHNNLKKIRYGVDFGWTTPSCILAVGFDGDDRAYVLDEFYGKEIGREFLFEVLLDFSKKYGKGPVICDPSSPESIAYFNENGRDYGIFASKYEFKRKEGIAELGCLFQVAGDGKPRIFVNSRCENLIAELFEYRECVKANDHAVDALRYSIPLKSDASSDGWVFGM